MQPDGKTVSRKRACGCSFDLSHVIAFTLLPKETVIALLVELFGTIVSVIV
jgi:hypothetical protein